MRCVRSRSRRPYLPLIALVLASCDAQSLSARIPQSGCSGPSTTAAKQHLVAALPALTGRVVDDADLLSSSAEASVVRELQALESRTSDQLVVVTTPVLGGMTIEEYGRRLGNGWRIGQAQLDNGVLLIVAPNERKVRIEVGCGLEGLLTDARAARIIHEVILPRLRIGSYEEGISSGARAIVQVLEQDLKRPQPRDTR